MKLDDLAGRRVVIWGAGREGRAFARLVRLRGAQVTIVDDDPSFTLNPRRPRGDAAAGQDEKVVAPHSPLVSSAEVIVRSPGVSRYRPELVRAAAQGIALTTPFAVWLDDFQKDAVLAITGTKGKSTTATLAALLLDAEGHRVALAGNIGTPVSELYGEPPSDIYVTEVSSYQAADVTTSPRAVVLTSLAPDHLDWHGGVEQYYADKLNLINAGPAEKVAVSGASTEALARTTSFVDRLIYGPTGTVSVVDDWIVAQGEALVDIRSLKVPGAHNVWNLCGAIAGAMLVTNQVPSAASVTKAVANFDGLPSRCASVGVIEGVKFVDDALASNPFAAANSVAAFPQGPLTIILGGASRGADSSVLEDAILVRETSPAVVFLPPVDDQMIDRLRERNRASPSPLTIVTSDDLEHATRAAARMTPAGGTVLFSPAAPTPAAEGTYVDRSRRFQAVVEELGKQG